MGTKPRETIYGASVRAAAERAAEARKEADKFAVAAWNARMLGFDARRIPSIATGSTPCALAIGLGVSFRGSRPKFSPLRRRSRKS
jgi:hypothetical protein